MLEANRARMCWSVYRGSRLYSALNAALMRSASASAEGAMSGVSSPNRFAMSVRPSPGIFRATTFHGAPRSSGAGGKLEAASAAVAALRMTDSSSGSNVPSNRTRLLGEGMSVGGACADRNEEWVQAGRIGRCAGGIVPKNQGGKMKGKFALYGSPVRVIDALIYRSFICRVSDRSGEDRKGFRSPFLFNPSCVSFQTVIASERSERGDLPSQALRPVQGDLLRQSLCSS